MAIAKIVGPDPLIEQLLQFFGERNALYNKAIERQPQVAKNRLQVFEQHIIVKGGRVFRRQHVDVLLREEKVAEIEQLEIGLEEFLRDFVVERLVGVMAFLEEPANGGGDIPRVGFRQNGRDREGCGQEDRRQNKK